jgi:hypothetical protein
VRCRPQADERIDGQRSADRALAILPRQSDIGVAMLGLASSVE